VNARPVSRLEAILAIAMPLAFLAVAAMWAWPFVDDLPREGQQGDDWHFYKRLATSIVNGGLTIPAIDTYTLLPHGFLYNYFVAGVFAVFGINTSYVYVIQAALVGLAASLLWVAARRDTTAWGGAVLLLVVGGTLYLDFVTRLSFRLLSENLFLVMAAACLAALVAAERRRSLALSATAGALLGLAILSRTSALASALGLILVGAAAVGVRRGTTPAEVRLTPDATPAEVPLKADAPLVAVFVAGFAVAMCLLPLREYAAIGRPNFDLITHTQDWVQPPEGLAPKVDYYGRRLLFALGATDFVNPDYRPRPHWALIWLGVMGYLATRVWWRQWPTLLETCILVMLPLYLGPVWLFAGIDNYGGRMVAMAMPFAAVLAARFAGDVRERL
jgi:hypothetical protein